MQAGPGSSGFARCLGSAAGLKGRIFSDREWNVCFRPGQAVVDLQRALDLSPEAEQPVIAEKLAAARKMQLTQAANEPIVEEPPDVDVVSEPHTAASSKPKADSQSAPESR